MSRSAALAGALLGALGLATAAVAHANAYLSLVGVRQSASTGTEKVQVVPGNPSRQDRHDPRERADRQQRIQEEMTGLDKRLAQLGQEWQHIYRLGGSPRELDRVKREITEVLGRIGRLKQQSQLA